jgi:hypothetical protein
MAGRVYMGPLGSTQDVQGVVVGGDQWNVRQISASATAAW